MLRGYRNILCHIHVYFIRLIFPSGYYIICCIISQFNFSYCVCRREHNAQPLVIKKEGGRRPHSKMTRVDSYIERSTRIRLYPSHFGRWPSATFHFNYKGVLLRVLARWHYCQLRAAAPSITTITITGTTQTKTPTKY